MVLLMTERSLTEIAADRDIVDPALSYYAVTLTVNERGQTELWTQTQWDGWVDEQRLTERRVPSLVKPEALIRFWEMHQQPYIVVKDERAWFVYVQIGGHALIAQNVAETFLSEAFQKMGADPAIHIEHQNSGFVSLDLMPKHTTQRAPTPKLRIEVLNRDHRRCRVCGSSPANDVHVELHVHHIRPWEWGGHTHSENRITLCHTCHKGLAPHYDHSLFQLLPRTDKNKEFSDGVRRYRERLQAIPDESEVEAKQKTKRPRHPWKRRRHETG